MPFSKNLSSRKLSFSKKQVSEASFSAYKNYAHLIQRANNMPELISQKRLLENNSDYFDWTPIDHKK